jgi:hypothetical protein
VRRSSFHRKGSAPANPAIKNFGAALLAAAVDRTTLKKPSNGAGEREMTNERDSTTKKVASNANLVRYKQLVEGEP